MRRFYPPGSIGTPRSVHISKLAEVREATMYRGPVRVAGERSEPLASMEEDDGQ